MTENKKRQRWLATILKILVFAAVVGFVTFSVRSYQAKKEAEMMAEMLKSEREKNGFQTGDKEAVRVYNGKEYRQNTLNTVILCVGVDTSGVVEQQKVSGAGGQADVMALLIQNRATDEVNILTIPRDTMTEIRLFDLNGNYLGTDVQHLNLAYGYGDGEQESCELLTEAVENLLGGVEIDGYVSVNMSAIPVLNDLVGGVTVTIDDPGMEGRDPSLPYGETVTLHGKQAETYVRYRDINVSQSAISRMDRHKTYAKGWMEQARNEQQKDSQFLGKTFDALQEYMVTDLNKDAYLDAGLAAMGTENLFGGDHFFTVPGEGTEGLVYDEFYPDGEAFEEMIIELFYRET